MAEAVENSYEKLMQDAMDGTLPVPKDICKTCTAFGVPFSVNGDSGPRQGDQVLGIPSLPESATDDWLLNNRWIRDKAQNFRDTFLLRVIKQLAADHGEAYLAELYAFLAKQGYEFACIDDAMVDDNFVTPLFVGEALGGRSTSPGTFQTTGDNFTFLNDCIYFWTFTSARWTKDEPNPSRDEYRSPFGNFDWTVSGLYDVKQAAAKLDQHYQQAKKNLRIWEAIKGAFEVATAVLAFVPIVGEVEMGAIVAYKAVRYTVAAVDAALAVNAMIDGSSRVITGEGLDVGEKLFERIGALADPKDGAERGRQVFMVINLAMLTPAAFGGARWALRSFRRDGVATARLDTKALTEAERAKLQGKQTAEVSAIELRLEKRLTGNAEEGKVTVSDLPSVDSNQSLVSVVTQSGRANVAVMSRTLRDRLALMITQHVGSVKVIGRMCKVVGDAGEEALAAAMVERWGFKSDNILGYSNNPAIAHRFGLTNKSGHGLDMLVWVPPPPTLPVRAPTTDTMRHSMDGLNGVVAPPQVLTFTERTLVVIETKATLGGLKTPWFNRTQQFGVTKVKSILKKIASKRGHWKSSNILEVDPDVQKKIDAINGAVQSSNIQYLHAQVFFDHRGQLNSLVGGGTGIQLNLW
ncbi:hypothetical protein G3N59_30685 [Paraburkholderia sp. Ac-20340]|uniref:hypothetical protein n=1 Tax=Paraburkholderia sp. Ac-20340 TaxID=2703888 RepID=UPI00197DFA02|nr:hypothetical protein [Paraburkholderia sp. Ac-20340]MBN3857761.1 hypothetical protein [Paraburkholderia sp. Ac-20340]